VGYIIVKNGARVLRIKSFYGHNEKQLLENFAFLLNTHFNKDKHLLCAHNGKEFDFPYIARRMLINEIKLPRSLNLAGKKPWEVHHIDTLELWKFGDYKHYTSLDLLTAIFNIPSPKTQIDGSQVNKIYWNESDIPKIADYCQKDVIALCQLLLKFKGEFEIEKLQIEITTPSLSN
jgi:DNA polymerase elongation subunit (family B)